MKYLVLCLLLGCISGPKYTKDTCFKEGFIIVQIMDIQETKYLVNIVTILGENERLFSFKEFEKEITSKGLIGKSCAEYR